jgi:hypothetical protein
MEVSVKAREDRVRRALAKYDLALKKTPSRSWLRSYYGPGYMIVDEYSNVVVSGAQQREYEDNLEYVEWYAFEHLVAKQKAA